jgi:hypothetical protein
MFSVPLVRQVTLPGRYPAHCPVEFGLSSRPRPSGFVGQARQNPGTQTGDRQANCDGIYRSSLRSSVFGLTFNQRLTTND